MAALAVAGVAVSAANGGRIPAARTLTADGAYALMHATSSPGVPDLSTPPSSPPAPVPTAGASVEPYIPASQSLPELTVGVFILGSVLAAVLGAANAYLGMFAAMTVSASIPAAVLSM